ncbi:MAG: hypothetical protein KDI43_09990 [Gammaproteobacteria bacterium]|nr:hypothetical protein [Gammaproteobacteria bacterium]MCP5406712.1 hypothetical protein [Chromatiaceae bacterium]MCP5444440.1 hypothetical protein [Chromatiaceae bacterium]
MKPGSEKSFGYVFAVIFFILGLYPAIYGEPVKFWCLIISVLLAAIALLRPGILRKPNYWWFRFGILLGGIIAPVVMGAVYLMAILPTGLIMRSLGKDPLKSKQDKSVASYWIKRDTPLQPMKNQF